MRAGLEELFQRVSAQGPGPWWLKGLRGLAQGASRLYGLGVGARNLRYDLCPRASHKLPAPVVGVGNLGVGGTGKTPLVMAVVKALGRLGLPCAVISRGYGGSAQAQGGVTWVSLGQGPLVGADQAGDEPVLLARRLGVPVAVGADRLAVGRAMLARCGPRVLVGDDLFQHRRLRRDLDLLALDAAQPLGNGRLLPAGPLREAPQGLRRAQAVVLTRADDPEALARTRAWLRDFWGPGPVLACRHRLAGLDDSQGRALAPERWQGAKVLAFCGLGKPQGFAASLRGLGLELTGFESFGDHHAYTPAELEALLAQARSLGAAALLTSEKDQARLPAAWPPADSGLELWVSRLELAFDGGLEALERVLAWGLSAWSKN